jgi:hypothetical protein
VQLRWNVLIEIDLQQQGHQISRLMHINAAFPRTGDDLLGQKATSFGNDARRRPGRRPERPRSSTILCRYWPPIPFRSPSLPTDAEFTQ